jgi:flagellar biosynthetic protein FliR
LHHQVLRAFALSLETQAPGTFAITAVTAEAVIKLGSTVFVTGLKLALPVIALMIMVDLALALLGRINSHLQLLSLAFPAKMLASMALIAAMMPILSRVYTVYGSHLFGSLGEILRH